MESLGEKLRTTRESKGISFDQAGLDTKLAIRYLEALESENFSKFPGEAYITGFIRNYGAYLDLDADELLAMYRAIKIQEQPIPVEQLLRKPSVLPKIAIAILAVLLVGGLAWVVYLLVTGDSPNGGRTGRPPVGNPTEHVETGNFAGRFVGGDTFLISPGIEYLAALGQTRFELTEVSGGARILAPNGFEHFVDFLNPAYVDIDGDGTIDLRIRADDYDPNWGVRLSFEWITARTAIPEMELVPIGTASVTGQSLSTVLFSSPNAFPFSLQAQFQGGNMFRWQVLAQPGRAERYERFFQRGDEQLISHVHNGVRIWTSNAQAARFNVIGGGRTVPVEIGNPGEVVVADILWVHGADNVLHLTVVRLET